MQQIHKTAASWLLDSDLTNYPKKINKTRWLPLEKLSQTQKQRSPTHERTMDIQIFSEQ